MKKIKIIIFLLLGFSALFAQTEINTLVEEGIEYHDQGDYDKAIKTYQKALKIDAKSPLVNYELALSYFSKGDYKNAVKYSDKVLKEKSDYIVPALVTKGSALDNMGKTKKSIKLFEKAIKDGQESYLLQFNLALNYLKINELDKAEENAIQAIMIKPNHTTSHLLLATVHSQKGNAVQALLASHYFLFLEPNSQRSLGALNILKNNFNGNVSKDKEKDNTINITMMMGEDDEFSPVALMISMMAASNMGEENEGKTEDELFVENTKSFFAILGELRKKSNKGIWWDFYTDFFYKIAESNHIETYCKYITQSENENSKKWLEENEDKLTAFGTWLENL